MQVATILSYMVQKMVIISHTIMQGYIHQYYVTVCTHGQGAGLVEHHQLLGEVHHLDGLGQHRRLVSDDIIGEERHRVKDRGVTLRGFRNKDG